MMGQVKFKNKKDCGLWCKTYNHLGIDVELVTIRYGKRLTGSVDSRLRAVRSLIYKLVCEFQSGLKKGMDEIKCKSE